MPTQGDLLRDNALEEHELRYGNWLREARIAAWKWARDHGTVSADEVQRLCPPPPWVHHNAMGAVFKSEHFRCVGFVNSTRTAARARTIRVYEIVRAGDKR